jgi:1,4-dihydroxy-2-naphthoate octaprenyltransferase
MVIYLLESLSFEEMGSFAKTIRAWLALSRPPFHIVGALLFILGSVLAWWLGGSFRWEILAWGAAGVVCVMLATYYAGEWWDYAEDSLSGTIHTSPFAGGSQVVQRGLLPREAALWGSFAAVLLALGVGVVLQFGYHTGPWTLPLGIVGLVGGLFYSAQPARWVHRGWGELWIAFCYGWLTVATDFYLQMGSIVPLVTLVALPIALTIFNVILLNEFLDYWADRAAAKTNLVVRLGGNRRALVRCRGYMQLVRISPHSRTRRAFARAFDPVPHNARFARSGLLSASRALASTNHPRTTVCGYVSSEHRDICCISPCLSWVIQWIHGVQSGAKNHDACANLLVATDTYSEAGDECALCRRPREVAGFAPLDAHLWHSVPPRRRRVPRHGLHWLPRPPGVGTDDGV